jgi:prevent-host-death family protein
VTTSIGTHEAKTHLSEYLNRVAYGGERIIVERHGKPVAALVSVEDLKKLESIAQPSSESLSEEEREERFFQIAKAAGLIIRRPTGKPVPRSERHLITVEGPPLSEQIVADREERDRLLSGQ